MLALVLQWLRQCFWNYLDWRTIVLYVYLTTLHGIEFQVRAHAQRLIGRCEWRKRSSLACLSQVYTVVAVVKHLAPTLHELSSRHNSGSVAAFETLVRLPIAGFRFARWRKLFLRLRNAYHDDVVRLLNDDSSSRQAAAAVQS